MGKHGKKHNSQQNSGSANNFDFNNFDMNQLGSLLNNVDLNQLSSMFQGMNSNNNDNITSTPTLNGGDRRLELLNAIKPLVDADKSKLIDTMIQIYSISKIMKK